MRKVSVLCLLFLPSLALGASQASGKQVISDFSALPVTAKDVDGTSVPRSVKTRLENLVNSDAIKAPIASPTFTGSPVVPGYLTSTTAASTYAPLASPTFTGTATAPKVVTSATSGSHGTEIVDGSKHCLDGATCSQWIGSNAAGIPGAQAWQAPTLLNSWVNFGGSFATVAYYRDAVGIVHLKGRMKTGTVGTIAFTLPAGY